MKFSIKKLICAAVLGGALLFNGAVEAGVVTDRLPLTCYCDHQVSTYNTPNGGRVGYISANVDLIQVTQVRNDGWAYGTYPTSRGRIARWFRISDLCADVNYSNRSANVSGSQNVFRTNSGGDTIGSVSNNESVIVIADNGTRAQIVYRLDNGTGYKMGWIPSSALRQVVGDLKGDVNNDGKVDQTDLELLKKHMVGISVSINRSNADMNNDGQISLVDVSILTDKVNQVPPDPIPTDYDSKVTGFINDNRFKAGTRWNNCFTYASQFTQQVFGKANPRQGAVFYSANEIRNGDVVHVNAAGGKSQHWIVVLYRNGNNLTTIEGNWTNQTVRYSTSAYTIQNGTLYSGGSPFRAWDCGYHFQ